MMKPTTTAVRPLFRILGAWMLAAWALAMTVAGCGGGVGSGGTGTYASGPISGFGSIIVNDVRFDETSASVRDDDDGMHQSSELKLGMTVAVDSDAIRTDASGRRAATASQIRFGSEIVGPVGSVNPGAGTLSVLGQTVRVAVETVFDDRLAGGLAGVAAGQGIEVYALFDAASGSFNATRIEPRGAMAMWRLRGPVAALDTAARTLRIGAATFSYGGAAGVPADLAVGSIVRLSLTPAPDGAGRYVVSSFGVGMRPPEDRDEAELKGLLTALDSRAGFFRVNGLLVDATAVTLPAGLQLGARVEARGSIVGGVLRATRVTVQTDDEVRERGFELEGSIAAVDRAARTFELRGVTVSWARADLRLSGGTLSDLAPGRRVEVKAQPSADRTRMEATRIEFK